METVHTQTVAAGFCQPLDNVAIVVGLVGRPNDCWKKKNWDWRVVYIYLESVGASYFWRWSTENMKVMWWCDCHVTMYPSCNYDMSMYLYCNHHVILSPIMWLSSDHVVCHVPMLHVTWLSCDSDFQCFILHATMMCLCTCIVTIMWLQLSCQPICNLH